MRLVYSRNKKAEGNASPGMEYFHQRDEPARIVHVLDERPGRTGFGPVTICGAPVGTDAAVPDDVVLPNCALCIQIIRRPSWKKR